MTSRDVGRGRVDRGRRASDGDRTQRHRATGPAGLGAVALVAVIGWTASFSPDALGRDRAGYTTGPRELFRTAEGCVACHNGLVTPQGEDVSIGAAWSATMMANSARDPYWQASVRREILDHPLARAEIENECATCHMPMARYEDLTAGVDGGVFARIDAAASGNGSRLDTLAMDGVSCTMCHQIRPERLGTDASFTGRFFVDTVRPIGDRPVFGPHEIDPGRATIMHSSSEYVPEAGTHMRSSDLCGSCHTLITDALGEGGRHVGRLPEQMPYLEWRHSAYSRGPTERSCQSCHMPPVADSMPISSVWGQPRPGLARHEFLGGNFFMLRMLDRYRDDLGVTATSEELQKGARRTIEHLQERTARLRIENARIANGRLEADVVVENLAGHKLPTGYPSRRAWLNAVVVGDGGARVFESGGLRPDGSIAGNDGDAEPGAFEPHHRVITGENQVQIFESVMAGPDGRVTTGLLTGVRFVKDNRVLPAGFDKSTAAPDIAVAGDALSDPGFAAGASRVRYSIDVSRVTGGLRFEVALMYQPIAFRWAHNLTGYDAPEIGRFVTYYRAMAAESAVALVRSSVAVR